MNKTNTILVFDSGLGGLSIVKELRKLQLNNDINYVADNLNFPYGELADDEIIQNTANLLLKLHAQIDPSLIIIACNTASTIALPSLRKLFQCPIVGVVPAIKPAATLSKTKHIGLLATPATINRTYTDQLIEDFASKSEVYRIGSTRLVELAENDICETSAVNLIREELSEWLETEKKTKIDTIVLGCTHFPLIKELIQQAVGNGVRLIDSGHAIARQTAKLLPVQNTTETGENLCFFSSQTLTDQQKRCIKSHGFKEMVLL